MRATRSTCRCAPTGEEPAEHALGQLRLHTNVTDPGGLSTQGADMDALSGWASATSGDKLKAACTAQLGVALLLSIWGAEFGSAVAVLGCLAVTLSLGELLKVFFYLEAFCFLVNLVSLFGGWAMYQWSWAFLLLLQLGIEGAAVWYAYSSLNETMVSDSYQGFGGDAGHHGGQRSDPFQPYEPPAPAQPAYQPQQAQPQQQQQQQPQQQQHPPGPPANV